MVDVVNAVTRSRMMAGIRAKNTRPEIIIRKGLHAQGFRYTLHPKSLPGKPDIVMPKWHVAIFIHGCFWHRHGCSLSKLPASNTAFWETKLAANRSRDEVVKMQLAAAGWRTAIVWECAIRGRLARESLGCVIDRLATWIRDQDEPSTLEIAGSDLLMSLPPVGNNST